MRNQAFEWLALQAPGSLFTVTSVTELSACDDPGDFAWREIQGTFWVPNFLSNDPGAVPPPEADPIATPDLLGLIAYGEVGPVQTGIVDAPFGIALPCSARHAARPGLVLGHGLFGSGVDFPRELIDGLQDFLPAAIANGVVPEGTALDLIAAGTHWTGLSTLEVPPLPDAIPGSLEEILADPVLVQQLFDLIGSLISQIFIDFDQFQALPDRLRQGQLHALVLARLLHTGVFNAHPCFQRLDPAPADCRTEPFGDPSLGVLAAGEPTYYFGASLGGIIGLMFAALSPDVERVAVNVPAVNFSFLLQRSFAFAPFSAFLGFFAQDPLRQALGLQVLHEIWVRGGSAGYANHITGTPLAPIDGGGCKPHGRVAVIPAALLQLVAFLTPDGVVENFCNGACDAAEPLEIPYGEAEPCDPTP